MKRFTKIGLTGAIIAGTLFTGWGGASAKSISVNENYQVIKSQEHGTLDLAIINDEKLLESFVKRGLLSKDASVTEKQTFLRNYIELKSKSDGVKDADPLTAKVKAADSTKKQKFKEFNNGLLNGKGNKNGHFKKGPEPVQETPYTGEVREDNVLVLAVEYSDFEHNNIKQGETDNYYKDYTLGHYEDMIFGDDGVEGPNGEDLISMKEYYLEQSGGTYTVKGNAYGWLKVPGTAAFYGSDASSGHDNVAPGGSKQLVRDTYKAALAAGVPLENYDVEDPHDLDGDGNLMEPDGLVDHLMIIHSGIGQEAGGGSLGDNAIWSHRSASFYDLDGLGTGKPGFYDYTMMPEDGAVGVFAHEYGHDLGLPDEYDTQYSGAGEPVSYWSIMASGSWAGKIAGTEPTGFSPWAKTYFQSTMGGNWTDPVSIEWKDVSTKGTQFLLDQANSPNGKNNQAVKVNLPQKKEKGMAPLTGNYSFFGGKGDEIDTTMATAVDLTGKSSASLEFDAWYEIEEGWDFAFVQVSEDNGDTWTSLENDNTTYDVVSGVYPTIPAALPGFTGTSNGLTKQVFDLSDYAGKKIDLRFRYVTDWGYNDPGIFVDNVNITADGEKIFTEGGESSESNFTHNGFDKYDGYTYSDHYYLLEWRNHQGVDEGLANIKRGSSLMSFDGGLVVWYVDPSYTDNWTGIHPGDGFLGVVDAHADESLVWSSGEDATTRYHVRDAAFGLNPTSPLDLLYPTMTLTAPSQEEVSLFNDAKMYTNTYLPDAGRNLTNYGLKVRVNGQAKDHSVGSIVIYK